MTDARASTGGAPQAASRDSDISFSRNHETVLVVEGNPEIRETTLQRVEGLAYVVAEAASGSEAMDILSNVPDIALVLSDAVIAGGMSGYKLGRRIQANRPEIRVVLTSGFAPEPTDASLESQFPLLRKPFSRAELSRALSHALYGPDAD